MPKKTLIITISSAFSILVVFMMLAFAIASQKRAKDTGKSTPPGDIVVSQSPTTAPIPSPTIGYSGADVEANEQYLKENPQLIIESRLKMKLPLDQENFTLGYSYEEDKFVVKLKVPYDQARNEFNSWMSRIGLTDITRFILLESK